MVSVPAGETERLNTEKMLTDSVEPFSPVTVSGNKVDRLQTPLFPHFISYNTMCLSTQCVCVCAFGSVLLCCVCFCASPVSVCVLLHSSVLCGVNHSAHEQQARSGFVVQKEEEGPVDDEGGWQRVSRDSH